GPVQLVFVRVLQARFADVIGAPVIRIAAFILEFFEILLIDAADVADDVREQLTLRILPEKSGTYVDPWKAVAVSSKSRDLLVGQTGSDRQAFETLAFLEQLFEAAAVARCDLDEPGNFLDHAIQIFNFAWRDFERVGRVVVREDNTIAV